MKHTGMGNESIGLISENAIGMQAKTPRLGIAYIHSEVQRFSHSYQTGSIQTYRPCLQLYCTHNPGTKIKSITIGQATQPMAMPTKRQLKVSPFCCQFCSLLHNTIITCRSWSNYFTITDWQNKIPPGTHRLKSMYSMTIDGEVIQVQCDSV